MRRLGRRLAIPISAALLIMALAHAGASRAEKRPTGVAAAVALKDAKLNIEHNATDEDTGFQGFIDSEGWRRLDMRGPKGRVLSFEAAGALRSLGLTELFFETVEPENKHVPIEQVLAKLPPGWYTIAGAGQEGRTSGRAWLTHDIPEGPELVTPADGATVPVRGVVARWRPVTTTITGDPVRIVAYQLIVEQAGTPHRHMIGKFGLSMYLSPSVTQIRLPNGFLEPCTNYEWEVLAIERSGNQTLSSGSFRTR